MTRGVFRPDGCKALRSVGGVYQNENVKGNV